MARKKSTEKAEPAFTLIPRRKLLALYAGLIECRMVNQALGARRGSGREAPAVAVAIDLGAADTLAASRQDPLPAFIKTKKREAAMAALRKPATAKPASPAALLREAVEAARRCRRERRQKIVAVFAAAPWTRSAAWRSALQTAGAEKLPILFVVPGPSLVATGMKPRFPVIPVDREDVVALYRVAFESIGHARRGNGPTVIECLVWPIAGAETGSSTGPADAIGKMERYLAQAGIETARARARVESKFKSSLPAPPRRSR